MRIHEYEQGHRFYRKFLECNLLPEHYTPWTRQNIAFVKVLSDVLAFDEAIRRLQKNRQMYQRLSVKAQKWIAGYPNNTSENITLLFGGLLGEKPVTGKMMVWDELSKAGIWFTNKHFWLAYCPFEGSAGPGDSVLELDLKYEEVSGEEDRIAGKDAAFGGIRILYFPDRHPLQTGESMWAKKHVKNRRSLL